MIKHIVKGYFYNEDIVRRYGEFDTQEEAASFMAWMLNDDNGETNIPDDMWVEIEHDDET